jgi:thiol-disulfide isomerase/thioredoxin
MPRWNDSYAEAIARSKVTGKPILANFTGSDWCGHCRDLAEEVFDPAEFAAWAKENVVLWFC